MFSVFPLTPLNIGCTRCKNISKLCFHSLARYFPFPFSVVSCDSFLGFDNNLKTLYWATPVLLHGTTITKNL